MEDYARLIEHAFPLKQASLDSVHEKNVRHGHISTLHIWPARRPLAACRAALIATLLPDPGTPEGREELCARIGGRLVKKLERKRLPDGTVVEREKEETEGGILHWGRETENAADLSWFRARIRETYGGRAPRVLDPFAGGGAIPLEAMRLGCEATAVDINPVAWFILKCTLEYPQKLAGQTHPLPDHVLGDEVFMDTFYEAHPHLVGRTKKTRKQVVADTGMFPEWVKGDSGRTPKADLAWHVRAWGRWVLARARRDLARFYPTYADYQPLDARSRTSYEKLAPRLVPVGEDGAPDISALNADLSPDYLRDPGYPRWVAKPTVAYLWARTVTCKNCRATIPLLKTRWLCKKEGKRVVLTMEPKPDMSGVAFGVENNVAPRGGNTTQRREHDRRVAGGTMSRSGAKCPCCEAIMTMEDIRVEGRAGRLASVMTAVVVDGGAGKDYRLPTAHEIQMASEAEASLEAVFAEIPFGIPEEPLASAEALGFRVPLYGFDRWRKLFTPRQLLALGTFVKWTRAVAQSASGASEVAALDEAVRYMLACVLDRAANYLSTVCIWESVAAEVKQTFLRFALPVTWDFAEGNPLSSADRYYQGGVQSVAQYLDRAMALPTELPPPRVSTGSATAGSWQGVDLVVTDPPYYDAIPYSDLMDFFYIWLRRVLYGRSVDAKEAFRHPVSPKWDHQAADGELIDDSSRHGGDRAKSRLAYEDGMARSFQSAHRALQPHGRMVVVFAHKQPDAWETLVSAMIRAGFVVVASWPIATEMRGGVRNYGRASLASSVWLVCRKRPADARAGWDNQVLTDMRDRIRGRLREYWDAGIRGPDFVWAATGPALEAYSKHPVVKKANEPGTMDVGEFLGHVRRMVVDYVVGRVLSGDSASEADGATADRLDEPTAYYLLHRHDFGMDEAPAGACILYAVSCGISDRELAATWNLIAFTKGNSDDQTSEGDADAEDDSDGDDQESGSKVRLKTWAQRKSKTLGYDAPEGKALPLIDRVHCLMHLWKAGDLSKVDAYLDANGLRRQELFRRLLQSLIELSPEGSEERSLLESISNHVAARGAVGDRQTALPLGDREGEEMDRG